MWEFSHFNFMTLYGYTSKRRIEAMKVCAYLTAESLAVDKCATNSAVMMYLSRWCRRLQDSDEVRYRTTASMTKNSDIATTSRVKSSIQATELEVFSGKVEDPTIKNLWTSNAVIQGLFDDIGEEGFLVLVKEMD